jgi:hypothetical protein
VAACAKRHEHHLMQRNKFKQHCRQGHIVKTIAVSHKAIDAHLNCRCEGLSGRRHGGFHRQNAAGAAALGHAHTEGESHSVIGAGHGRHMHARFLFQGTAE